MCLLCCTVALLSGCGAGGGAHAHADRSPAQSLADAPVVTHDDVGYAVWVQPADKSGRSGLYSSRQRNGVWDLPQQIHVPTASHSQVSEPRWVVHPDGEATLVWLQLSQGVRQVFHSRTVKGVWRAGEPIRQLGGDAEARGVQIGADGVGNAVAVWSEAAVGDPVARSVWASRFDGGGFAPPEKLNMGDEPTDKPRVTLTGSGSALAVWYRGEGHRRSLSASVYWNGAWTPSSLVDSDASSDPLWAQVLPRIF